MLGNLKQKLSQFANWVRTKLFGPESSKVHLLDFEIAISWILIFVIGFGTFYGIYRARHWQWGILDKIPVISTIFNSGRHKTPANNPNLGGSGSQATQPPPKHIPTAGGLHTKGTKILDGNDRVVRLFSIGENYLVADAGSKICYGGAGSEYSAYYPNLFRWGINTVYLAFTWGALEPTAPTVNPDGSLGHHFSQSYLKMLDQAINRYNQHGIAVVLKMNPNYGYNANGDRQACPGGMPTWLLHPNSSGGVLQSACNFISNKKDDDTVPGKSPFDNMGDMWRILVQHYKSNPDLIGVDMINEPYRANFGRTCKSYNLSGLYDVVGAKIRQADRSILLMFEESSDADGSRNKWYLTKPIPFANSVYVFHLYASGWANAWGTGACEMDRPGSSEVLNVWQHAGVDFNVPVWMQEFNSFCYKSGHNDAQWSADEDTIMKFIKTTGMSFGFTAYTGLNGPVYNKTGEVAQPMIDKIEQAR